MPCTAPIIQDGNTFGCRRCDGCIAARRSSWVSRAMAEAAMSPYSYSITLTYSDATQTGRDGSSMFCYADVSAWLKRVRRAVWHVAQRDKWNHLPSVRFIAAGEQGSRNGRCHWHVILYTNFPIEKLGEWSSFGRPVDERDQMLTHGKVKRRLHWSLWAENKTPLGFVTLQPFTEGSAQYALSYCLKDQFTDEKSKGTMRESKSENFATGLFRMSKRPAIGESWLLQKMEALEASGSVLPNLHLQVPGLSRHYEPTGSFRKKLLWHLVALNQRVIWATGANAPQWPSLLSNCSEVDTDMEILLGTQTGQVPKNHPDYESDEAALAKTVAQNRHDQEKRSFAATCAKSLPCRDCLLWLRATDLAALELRSFIDPESDSWQFESTNGESYAQRAQRPAGKVNPYCSRRGSKIARLAAPVSGI